tara:strand:- start:415 stop:903 length:489 start_codon:yes stop_codon:yes gene_type:complete
MKPEVKKLVNTFAETAQAVKTRLKTSGFVLPVSHNGGVKYFHTYIKKNRDGYYDIVNLHNPKRVYYKDIGNFKIAVAIAIYLGNNAEFNEDELLKADNDYLRWYNEIRIFKYQLKVAEQQGNEMRIDMFEARIDQYTPKYNNAKQQVDLLLDQAETLLFDTK